MGVQNINNGPYRKYVQVYCDTYSMGKNLIQALDTLWKHPEGREKIIQAFENRGVLNIRYSEKVADSGYDLVTHEVVLAPKTSKLKNREEIWYQPILLETLAHEFYHAGDSDLTKAMLVSFKGVEIKKRGNYKPKKDGYYHRAGLALSHDYEQKETTLLGSIVPDNYHNLNHEKKRHAIETIIEERGEEIFDRLQALKQEHHEARKRMYRDHPQIAWYVQTYETPAIEFANQIVRETINPKFVGRISDYSDAEKDPVPTEYNPFTLKEQIFTANSFIRIAGGLENALRQNKHIFQKELAEKTPGALMRTSDTPYAQGALVNIADTPQAQVAQIEAHSKMQNAECAASKT